MANLPYFGLIKEAHFTVNGLPFAFDMEDGRDIILGMSVQALTFRLPRQVEAGDVFWIDGSRKGIILMFKMGDIIHHAGTRRQITEVRPTGYSWKIPDYGEFCPNGQENSFKSEDTDDPYLQRVKWEKINES